MKIRIIPFLPAITWLITSTILLSLPGDDLPENNFFDIPYFDKYVHFGMFFILTVLFCYPFVRTTTNGSGVKSIFKEIAIAAIAFGVAMEFVQKYLVINRSFDVIDIVFDTLGSVAGLIGISWYRGKKIGPNGNRGRNQN